MFKSGDKSNEYLQNYRILECHITRTILVVSFLVIIVFVYLLDLQAK